MALHPLLVRSVAQNLFDIFQENRYADKVIEQSLRNSPKAGSRDRSFIAETTYEVVRNYRLYSEILGKAPKETADYWQLVGVHLAWNGTTLPLWQEFKPLHSTEFFVKINAWKQPEREIPRSVRESVPDWLDALGEQELGRETWAATLQWLNKPAQVVLRANLLRSSRQELQKALAADGIETRAVGDGEALVLTVRKNVFQSPVFKKGWFEVQDYSSQLVAPLLGAEPGMRVVDACAGGGGKTLHLASLMQNKGNIIALDTLPWKLAQLKIRARRAGASNIETRAIENNKTIKRLHNTADRLLLDVPCSGLGVLRRNPDTKWKISLEQIENLRATQQDILRSYSPILKNGGRMVYATCSVLPSENIAQVEKFLVSEAGKSFHLLEERSILPQDQGFDGFYMALLEKR